MLYSTDLGCQLLRCYGIPHRWLWRRTLMCLMLLMAGMIKEGHFCNIVELRESYHIITSPGYPEFYIPKEDPCSWKFTADANKRVAIRFRDIDIKPEPLEGNCTGDSVGVFDDNNPTDVERFCGTTVPQVKISASNILRVNFDTTGENSNNRGFYAEIYVSDVNILTPITQSVHENSQASEVKIKCPNNISSNIVQSLAMSRFTDFVSQNYTTIYKSDDATQGNISGIQVEGDTASGLTTTLSSPTCEDGGIYKCTVVSRADATSADETAEEITLVSIIVRPGTTAADSITNQFCYPVGSTVNLRCSASIGSIKDGTNKRIVWERKTSASDWKEMTVIQSKTTWGRETPCNKQPNDEVAYNLTIEDVGADYRCIVKEFGVIETEYTEIRHNSLASSVKLSEVRDSTIPTKVMMRVQPERDSYDDNEELSMTCECSIGKEVPGDKTSWIWQRKKADASTWEMYNVNVENSEPENYVDRQCDRIQTSKITLKVTMDDSNREYRCYIVKELDGQRKTYENLAASYLIKAVDIPETDSSESNLAAIIGGTVGGILLLIVLTAIICYLCLRKKERRPKVSRKEERPKIKEEMPKPMPVPSILVEKEKVPPYAVPVKMFEPVKKGSTSVDPPAARRPSSSVDP